MPRQSPTCHHVEPSTCPEVHIGACLDSAPSLTRGGHGRELVRLAPMPRRKVVPLWVGVFVLIEITLRGLLQLLDMSPSIRRRFRVAIIRHSSRYLPPFACAQASHRPGVRDGSISRSDTPPVSVPGCEELKCDVVGISKRQCRVMRRVHDATVGDAKFMQTDFPCL